MTCPLCLSAGKRPPGFATSRRCAFDTGIFVSGNWNCETLNQLRDIAETRHHDDRSIGIIPLPESDEWGSGWIVLTWYKRRGAVGGALWMNEDSGAHPLRLVQAQAALAFWSATSSQAIDHDCADGAQECE
jgi:hypothetical protein